MPDPDTIHGGLLTVLIVFLMLGLAGSVLYALARFLPDPEPEPDPLRRNRIHYGEEPSQPTETFNPCTWR